MITKPRWKKPPMLGKKHSEKTKKIMALKKIGIKRPDMGGENNFFYGKKFWKGKKQSQEHIKKRIKIANEHWNWQGGITPLREQIRKCFKYRQWRSDIFTRDNFICILCGKKGGQIEADHYPKSFEDILKENKIKTLEEAENCEEFWNINNGRTLCKICHKLTYNYGKNY